VLASDDLHRAVLGTLPSPFTLAAAFDSVVPARPTGGFTGAPADRGGGAPLERSADQRIYALHLSTSQLNLSRFCL